MVLEQFVAQIHTGREAAFETTMEQALRTVMSRAEGLQGWSLRRCVEVPGRYQVQIRWASIEHHLRGYRDGPLAPEFRALVTPFFVQAPEMLHYEVLADG